jgi:hypothetical protein
MITERINTYLNENIKDKLQILKGQNGRHSNDFVDLMWDLFNKEFPS